MAEMDTKDTNESQPLKAASPDSSDDATVGTKTAKSKTFFSGRFVSKTKLILIAVAFLILILIIIILAALLGKERSRKETEDKHEKGKPGLITPTAPVPTTPGTEAWWNVRLPGNVVPVHYNLLMNITVDLPRFDGNVEIIVNVTSPTNLILVHAGKLNVSKVAVKSNQDTFSIKRQFWFKKNQFYVIEMNSKLDVGSYSVHISFEGFFASDMRALYRSNFKLSNGTRVNYAATQFEPVRARDAFPCFDEPALKATFTVTIAHRFNNVALSNMPIYKTEMVRGQKLDYFKPSVIMPTYLVAFVVGDFEYVEIITKDKVQMRVYSRPAAIDTTAFGGRTGSDVLTFFGQYFKIKYPLPKIDMIGLTDFGPGAMENWGLVIYRERLLLWDKHQSVNAKTTVAVIVTHELAHQWFGNIATMRWWDDLWLNEAFATYMPYVALASIQPTWKLHEMFITRETTRAMNLDGLSTSHPIRVPVSSPDEIGEIFDTISYAKGACVLRMLDDIVGNKTFADGLSIYLKTHAYGNAETDDLWRAIKQASCAAGKCVDVKSIMDTWVLQMGFPVVFVKKTGLEQYTVSQTHFLFDPKANVSTSKYKSPFGYTWNIPFSYVTSLQPKRQLQWMYRNSTTIKWDGSDWIKGNYGNKGYYLVNYEDSNWQELAKQLQKDHNVMSASDRAGLIFDAFSLAKASQLDYSVAFRITEYLSKERSYSPWKIMRMFTNYIKLVLPETSTAYKNLQKYLVYQARSFYDKLGYKNGGTYLEIYNRNNLLNIMCSAGETSCVKNSTAIFQAWMADPQNYRVPSNIGYFVYYYGIKYGGVKEWDFLYSQYQKSNSAADQRKMLEALGASREPWILSRYLKYSLDPMKFRSSVGMFIVWGVADGSSAGRRLAWDWVRMNWDALLKRYGSASRAYGRTAADVARGFSTEFELEEILEFNAKVTKESGFQSKSQIQTVEAIESNINWIKSNKKPVEDWLSDFMKKHNIK